MCRKVNIAHLRLLLLSWPFCKVALGCHLGTWISRGFPPPTLIRISQQALTVCKQYDLCEHLLSFWESEILVMPKRSYQPDCAVLGRSVVSSSATPWIVARQSPLSMGILQARILEWVAMPSSSGSPQPRDQTHVSCTAGRFFTTEPPGSPQRKETNMEIQFLNVINDNQKILSFIICLIDLILTEIYPNYY